MLCRVVISGDLYCSGSMYNPTPCCLPDLGDFKKLGDIPNPSAEGPPEGDSSGLPVSDQRLF